jgi:hypothetical protein
MVSEMVELMVHAVSCCRTNGRILLANLLQGSSSTFSGARFPRFLAFKEGMLDRQISTLGGSPTVSAPLIGISV